MIDFDYLEKLAKRNAYLEVLCELSKAKIDAIGKAYEAGLDVAIGIVQAVLVKLGV